MLHVALPFTTLQLSELLLAQLLPAELLRSALQARWAAATVLSRGVKWLAVLDLAALAFAVAVRFDCGLFVEEKSQGCRSLLSRMGGRWTSVAVGRNLQVYGSEVTLYPCSQRLLGDHEF